MKRREGMNREFSLLNCDFWRLPFLEFGFLVLFFRVSASIFRLIEFFYLDSFLDDCETYIVLAGNSRNSRFLFDRSVIMVTEMFVLIYSWLCVQVE